MVDRRGYLRSGAVLLGAGSLAAVGGCSGLGLGGSDEQYVDWVPDPGPLGWDENYAVAVYHPETIANDRVFNASADRVADLRRFVEPTGVDPESVEQVVDHAGGNVLVGDVPADRVDSSLRESDWVVTDEFHGFTIYAADDSGAAYGVNESAIVHAFPGRSTRTELEAVIEANAGERSRYDDANEGFRVLVEALSTGVWLSARPHERVEEGTPVDFLLMPDTIGHGRSLSLSADTVTNEFAWAYEDPDEVAHDDLETWADENVDVEDVSIRSSGPAGIVTTVRERDP